MSPLLRVGSMDPGGVLVTAVVTEADVHNRADFSQLHKGQTRRHHHRHVLVGKGYTNGLPRRLDRGQLVNPL